MTKQKFNLEDMPIIDVDTSRITPYESSQFLDGPEIISLYLSEAIKSEDPQRLTKALNQIAKSRGINKIAQAAGVNRESLQEMLKGDDKIRLETITKLLKAVDAPALTPFKRTQSAAK